MDGDGEEEEDDDGGGEEEEGDGKEEGGEEEDDDKEVEGAEEGERKDCPPSGRPLKTEGGESTPAAWAAGWPTGVAGGR